jgi:hypothetical protein
VTAEIRVTAEALWPEVDRLRVSGLATFDVREVELIARLAVEAGYATDGHVTVAAIRVFLQTAIGGLDTDGLQTSAAYLLGIAQEQPLASDLNARTKAAAACHGISPHGYNGQPPKGQKTKDIRMIADQLIAVHQNVVAGQAAERQRRADMPGAPQVVSIEPPQAVRAYMDGLSAIEWLERRRRTSNALWESLMEERDNQLARIGPLSPDVCVFASGSYGREEAMENSDVDLFVVDDVGPDDAAPHRLDKFELGLVLTVLDRTREARRIQRFSQGGYFQEPQSFRDMRASNGAGTAGHARPNSARTLLLANSKCFANEDLYHALRARMLDEYWRDEGGSRRPLVPDFLINDLRRLWLTMLIDYEHFYPKERLADGRRVSNSNRRIAGFKLGVAQKLGCFTPILAILERSAADGLVRTDAEAVLDMTTWQRLNLLADSSDPGIASAAVALRELYGQYLAFSNCNKQEMADRVNGADGVRAKRHFDKASTLILAMLWTYHARIPDVARFALV